MSNPRCQECGGEIKLGPPREDGFLEGTCRECNEVWWPAHATRTRARKRFELVVAMSDSECSDRSTWMIVEAIVERADDILTELYGEMP